MGLDNIKNAIKDILLMQENLLLFIEEDIDEIIENNIIDDKRVEELFEQLLNLFQTDDILNLFKKLGNYYYKINKELVIYYYNFYQEMYLDEDKKILKK